MWPFLGNVTTRSAFELEGAGAPERRGAARDDGRRTPSRWSPKGKNAEPEREHDSERELIHV